MDKIQTIGIPRGLMAYRDGVLWNNFFEQLGYSCVFSSKSDRKMLEEGTAKAIDEACLPFKMYLGHVAELLGKCDALFVPRMGGYKTTEKMCTSSLAGTSGKPKKSRRKHIHTQKNSRKTG